MPDYKLLTADYHRIRTISHRANPEVTKSLSKGDIQAAGRMLGLSRAGTLVFDSEQTMTVMMEFAVFDIVRDGTTAIERYAQTRMGSADPDERRYLRGACAAEYGVYGVLERIPGVGVMLRSLFTNEPRLLIDMGFGATAMPGLFVACRLLCLDDYWITTGAALPATLPDFKVISMHLETAGLVFDAGVGMTPEARSHRNALLIRTFLDSGASESIRYSNHEDSPATLREFAREVSGRRPDPPVGRYDPCPCGSGKKFKFCCEAGSRAAAGVSSRA